MKKTLQQALRDFHREWKRKSKWFRAFKGVVEFNHHLARMKRRSARDA